MITLTFGECAENHKGMEKIGEISDRGFTHEDLLEISSRIKDCKIYDLSENAYVLIVKNGVTNNFVNKDKLYDEMKKLNWDKKKFMYGRVVNSLARWNLCFSDYSTEADYENGKGTIIDYTKLKNLNSIFQNIEKVFGPLAKNLKCEGNYYYDISKCGIGYHGDSERRKVIGFRIGGSLPIYFQKYLNSEKIGERIQIDLEDGDIYIMSEKAVGTDWKKKKIYTFRHAVGCSKFIS